MIPKVGEFYQYQHSPCYGYYKLFIYLVDIVVTMSGRRQ